MSEVYSSGWVEHRARFQGRVAGFERRVRMGPKVADTGIDLRRNKSAGITGWKAENIRICAEAERRKARLIEMIEAESLKPVEIMRLPVGRGSPPLRAIQDAVCRHVKIPIDELLAFRRNRKSVKPRHIAMLLCKLRTQKSLVEIGRHFSGRDHTTVLHAVRKLEPIEKILWEELTDANPLEVWVSRAFSAWDEAGLK